MDGLIRRKSAGEPGWRFYAAAVFNEHNPWWIVMPDITQYLQRMSFLLRQGKPANDIAIYLPTDDAYAGFRAGHDSVDRSMEQLLGRESGAAGSGCRVQLRFHRRWRDRESRGVSYPVLILPNVERMPLATIRKIERIRGEGRNCGCAEEDAFTGAGPAGCGRYAADPRGCGSDEGRVWLTDDTKLGSTLTGLAATGFCRRQLRPSDSFTASWMAPTFTSWRIPAIRRSTRRRRCVRRTLQASGGIRSAGLPTGSCACRRRITARSRTV